MGAYARAHDQRARGALGARLPRVPAGRARSNGIRSRPAVAGPKVAGNGSNGKVLILDSTVSGGASSIEAQQAAADGYGVDIVDAATWSAMTADQFAAYRAIILGDPTCSGESSVAAAEANAMVWGPVIDGNIEIIGSDPVFHAINTNPAIAAVTQRGVDFAVGQSGKTGAYISLSCYFAGTSAPTHVSLLDGLDTAGTGFSVQGAGCSDSIHIEATSPALTGIDDTLLSNWNCSVHEYFDSWPAKFGVLAVDTNAGSLFTGPDGTTGDPYILASPGGSFQGTTETAGGGSLTGHNNQCQATSNPVNCATGEFWHSFTDLTVRGRGPALDLTRSYSSLQAGTDSPFGFGWSSSYTMSLAVDSASGAVQVTQENGSTTVFTPSSGGYAAPPRVYATLTKNADGTWTFVRHQRQRFVFDANGRLIALSDLNGYTTALSYNASGRLASVSDPEGRVLTFAYGGDSKIATVTDPAGRAVFYGYDASGNLTRVTDVAGGVWAFSYDANHLMTSMTDPRGGTVSNIYDATGRVTSQTDAMGRTTTFAYGASGTVITDPGGNVTSESYTQGQLVSLTKGSGTSSASTWTYTYDPGTLGMANQTDPNGKVTTYSYAGGSYNPTSVTSPLGRTATTTYNGFEEPLTVTDPAGTTTTYTYDANGNPLTVSRPLAGTSSVRTTTYGYGDPAHPGDVTSSTDPDGNSSLFSYDTYGDLISSTDPLGNKATYAYDISGRLISRVSPRGNASGADPASYTTSYSYDAFGDLLKQTDPLGHVTSYTYDADRNRTSVTDAKGDTTSYAYDAGDELTKVTRADGTTLSYAYDSNGNQTGHTDGAGHTTAYAFDPLNRVISVTDPLGRATSYGYDGAGNRTTLTDPSGRVTTFGYDAANELTSISYSDGTTPKVSYTYTADGQRATMADGTGTTSYTYDSLNRLTKVTDGAGQTTGYGYDLKGNVTALTYPNGKTVTRGYDAAGHLATVADWLGNTTKFSHDPAGNLTSEAYPNGVNAASSYDNADQLTSITDRTATSTLASFTYTRDNLGQVTSATQTGIPGGPQTYSYTQLSQLASDNGAPYSYDHSGNLTQQANGTTQTFDAASELISATAPVTSGPAAIDQVVSANETTRAAKIISPAVTTTSGNDLILAFVSADGPSTSAQKIKGVSGGGLTWSLAVRSNAQLGTAEVWQAHATGQLTNVKVTAALQDTGYDGSITVVTFTGAASAVGPTAGAGARNGAPSVSLTTTTANSLVWADGHDWDHATARTPATGQTLVHQFLDTKVRDTFWVQKTAAIPAAGTVVKVADTAPTTDRWELAAVEIPSSAATGTSKTSYGYDKQGNRATITPAGGSATTLTYDQANRLTAHGTTASYAYNGDGLRMSKTVSGTTTAFAWDQSGTLPLLLAGGTNYYIYGPGGQPIEQISGSTATYLHADQQGSTRLLTDATGNVVGTYTYGPYGNTTSHTGTAMTALQYGGQYTDTETGYQYLRARYYDPTTAQFLTRDPAVANTMSPYGYAAGNPLNEADPTGMGWCAPPSAIGTIYSVIEYSNWQCNLAFIILDKSPELAAAAQTLSDACGTLDQPECAALAEEYSLIFHGLAVEGHKETPKEFSQHVEDALQQAAIGKAAGPKYGPQTDQGLSFTGLLSDIGGFLSSLSSGSPVPGGPADLPSDNGNAQVLAGSFTPFPSTVLLQCP
jgi:RHS repeat-associated protein